MELHPDLFALAYLIATILFILGLKGLSHPKTALRGNFFAMSGMALAILATLLHPEVKHYTFVLTGLGSGALVGIGLALRVSMTAMPQLVAALHSFVGLSAVLVGVGTFLSHHSQGPLDTTALVELAVGSLIGAITFTGSLVAFGKLQEILKSNPLIFKGQHLLNLGLVLGAIGSSIHFIMTQEMGSLLITIFFSLALGFLLVLPIGGADMPVVVSMLNSYSGWAASATGFILNNQLLITTGALVGSSGAILSYIMCKAMNRSILSVIFGGAGSNPTENTSSGSSPTGQSVKSASVDDVGFLLENASRIIIVPGYGMAVAQAQHSIKELYVLLTNKGIEVKFAIHPVAGRMPGHMNVLLAESDIPYDAVFEMEEVNNEFSMADVALVVGANDVVNPAAKSDKASPLYGMPILDVYKAKHIFVSKRSMKAGYAGVDNALFYYPNCSLVFGDAKSTCEKLVQVIKSA